MPNLRSKPLSSSGLEPAPREGQRGLPQWAAAAAFVVGGLLALAWIDGGEEPLHPIAEDVALPEQAR
jgi:hypothetical protein